VLQCVALCCIVLHCVALCQWVIGCVMQRVAVHDAVCCSVSMGNRLRDALCCGVLQCVAVC